MIAGLVICFVYAVVVWLVFFYFKWIKFSIAWGVVSVLFGLHLLIIFMIGLRFVAPLSTEAKLVQHTIQLTPRLSEPTLVTDVLVAHNQHVKAGAPLFQFDRRPYEYKVRNLEAQLAKAKQDVLIDEADVAISVHKLAKLKDELVYTKYQSQLSANLAKQGAGPKEDAQKWAAQVAAGEAGILEAQADEQRARLRFTSDIDGVNTSVATIQAELALARFYLDNTIMVAPEDGYIMNLQVRPGMVAGDVRFGAIASLICDDDRYLVAQYFQENLKYVKPGQPVEVALDLYPARSGRAPSRASGREADSDRCSRAATCRTSTRYPRTSPRDSLQSSFDSTTRIRASSPSAPRGARPSTQTPRAAFPGCAKSASAPTHG